ncbi:MAG: tetratricopeptide repeat protein [Puniceicoccaceae bacterium]
MDFSKILETKPSLSYIAIGLLAFLLYANSLGNGFVFDDSAVLEQNQFVQQGVAGIPTILTTGSWDGYNADNHMHIYRPVQLMVLALQYELFGLNPFGYHLVHVLSYVALCVLVFWLLVRLFREIPQGRMLAFLTAILFAAHPIHTEVVANIKGNGDLIAMLLGVVSLHFLWQYAEKKNPWNLLWLATFFLLALMTKETIVCLVGIAFLILYFFSSMSLKKALLSPIPMLASVGIYLVIRSLVFGENAQELTDTSPLENVILMADGTSQQLGIRLWALGKNLQLLAYPYPLAFMYVYNSVPLVEFWDIRSLLPLLIYTILGVVFILNFKKNNIWGFAIGFYFVALALFSNTVVGIPNIVSERWLLLPSLGFCIALAYFLILLFQSQKAVSLLLLSMILFGYSGYTIQRNFAWKSNLTLAETDILTAPENLIINGVLANMLLGEASKTGGDPELLERAAYHYEKAVEMNPSDYVRMNNLGLVYEQLGEHEKAAIAFAKAKVFKSDIQGKAGFSEAKNWYLAEDYNRALITFREVDKAHPNTPEVAFYMAKIHRELDQDEESKKQFERAMEMIDKFDSLAKDASNSSEGEIKADHATIGNMILAEAGKYANNSRLLRSAAKHFEIAIEQKPKDWNSANNLGLVYEQLREHGKAAVAFAKAKATESPIQGKASFSEAKNLYLARDFDKALDTWTEVDQLYPDNPDVAFFLAQTYAALNRKQESTKYYQRVIDLSEKPEITPTDASIVPRAKAKLSKSQ